MARPHQSPVDKQAAEILRLQRENSELRAECRRLKGELERVSIKPTGRPEIWWVLCAQHVEGPFTERKARQLASVENAMGHAHWIWAGTEAPTYSTTSGVNIPTDAERIHG